MRMLWTRRMRQPLASRRRRVTFDAINRDVQPPISRYEDDKRRRKSCRDAGQSVLERGQEMHLTGMIGSDGDDNRHDERVADQVDAAERIDRCVEDNEE